MKEPPGANAPRKPSRPASAPKRPKGAEGVEPGDSVYVKHPKRGAMALTVTATGRDGFTGRCDAKRKHCVPWDRYVGHRARMLHRYDLVEQGADGALVKDQRGKHRFIAGLELPEPADAAAPAAAPATDDPILGGLDRLKKAEPMPTIPATARLLLLKAGGPIANRPGLTLQTTSDQQGHQTHRWKKTGPDMPSDKPVRPPMQHGDTVKFRHGEVEGHGQITASGADGVTVKDPTGREHQVRHEHLVHPHDAAAEAAGGAAPNDHTGGLPHDKLDHMDARPGPAAPVPPEKFSAAAHFQEHDAAFAKANTDSASQVAAVLAGFPPDTSAKMAAMAERLKGVQETKNVHMKDGAYTPERSKLHDSIMQHFLAPEKIAAAKPADGAKPNFTILGGRGGSGKSWFNGKVFDPAKAIVLDADEIKHMLPEYEGWNAFQVHEESGDLFDKITEAAHAMGLNIVHDATMKTPAKAVALVTKFKDSGYATEAHYMHLPREEAAKRAVKRFLGPTGRFVPPEVILGNTKNEQAFDQVRALVDKWSFRDNQNTDGSGPKLISEGSNGTAQGATAAAGSEGGKPAAGGAGEDGRNGLPGAGGSKPGGNAGVAASPARPGEGGLRKSAGIGGVLAGGGRALFLKAAIRGGAVGDLFGAPSRVAGYMRGGAYVEPYSATRQHKPAVQQSLDTYVKQPDTAGTRVGPVPLHLLPTNPAESERSTARAAVAERDGPKPIPGAIRDKVSISLRNLRAHADALEAARRLDGHLGEPHHEADYRREHGEHIARSKGNLAKFREVAGKNGADHAGLIGELGGEADVDATGPIKPEPTKNLMPKRTGNAHNDHHDEMMHYHGIIASHGGFPGSRQTPTGSSSEWPVKFAGTSYIDHYVPQEKSHALAEKLKKKGFSEERRGVMGEEATLDKPTRDGKGRHRVLIQHDNLKRPGGHSLVRYLGGID